MDAGWEDFAFLIWAVGSLAIFLAYVVRENLKHWQRRDDFLKNVAAHTGLTYTPGGFFSYGRVRGIYGGHYVVIGAAQNSRAFRSQRSGTQMETRVAVRLAQPRLKQFFLREIDVSDVLHLSHRTFTGNGTFDGRFRLLASPHEFATEVVGPNRNLWKDWHKLGSFSVQLEGDRLIIARPGLSAQVDNHVMLLDTITQLADALEDYGGAAIEDKGDEKRHG